MGSTKGDNGHASRLPMLSDKRRDTNADRVSAIRKSATDRARSAREAAARTKASPKTADRGTRSPRTDADAGRTRPDRQSAAPRKLVTVGSDPADIKAARDSYDRRVQSGLRGRVNGQVGGRQGGAQAGGTTHVGNPNRPLGSVWNGRRGNFNSFGSQYYNNCYWNTWGNVYCSPFSSWFCAPFYSTGIWWNSYWRAGGGWGFGGRRNWRSGFGLGSNFFYYGPFLPAAQTIVYYDEPEPEVIYVEAPVEEALPPAADAELVEPQALPALPPQMTAPTLQRELNRAAAYYLTQGDRAFRETRYGDAVHFYGKAVEFAPDSGILYLVLSDALFATGDYRYAAYALRQAFDRDPELSSNIIDKREFYADPSDFDTQLGTLERFVEDHVLDMDARLVLAANYLFGGQPESAMVLLENPFSEELARTDEGMLLLSVSRQVAAGEELPVPSTETPNEF